MPIAKCKIPYDGNFGSFGRFRKMKNDIPTIVDASENFEAVIQQLTEQHLSTYTAATRWPPWGTPNHFTSVQTLAPDGSSVHRLKSPQADVERTLPYHIYADALVESVMAGLPGAMEVFLGFRESKPSTPWHRRPNGQTEVNMMSGLLGDAPVSPATSSMTLDEFVDASNDEIRAKSLQPIPMEPGGVVSMAIDSIYRTPAGYRKLERALRLHGLPETQQGVTSVLKRLKYRRDWRTFRLLSRHYSKLQKSIGRTSRWTIAFQERSRAKRRSRPFEDADKKKMSASATCGHRGRRCTNWSEDKWARFISDRNRKEWDALHAEQGVDLMPVEIDWAYFDPGPDAPQWEPSIPEDPDAATT